MDYKGRTWELIIGIEHYYLTEYEANFYMAAVDEGSELIQLPSGLVLSRHLQALIPPEVAKTNKLIAGGFIDPASKPFIPSAVLEKKYSEDAKNLPDPLEQSKKEAAAWKEKRERIIKARQDKEAKEKEENG